MLAQGKSSKHASSPAFSLGAVVKHVAAKPTPGVGTYSVTTADQQCLPSSGAATFKGKLRHGGIIAPSCSPPPGTYRMAKGVGHDAELDWKLRWGGKYKYCNYTDAEPESLHGTYSTAARHRQVPSKWQEQVTGKQQQRAAAESRGQLMLDLLPTFHQDCDHLVSCSITPSEAAAEGQSITDLNSHRSGSSMLSLRLGAAAMNEVLT